MLFKFHAPLIRALIAKKHQVWLASPIEAGQEVYIEQLQAMGAEWRQISLARSGTNPIQELRTLVALYALFRDIRVDVVLAYSPKPVIYGTIAAWLARVPRRYALITGLGYAFTGPFNHRRAAIQAIVRRLLRVALARAHGVMFQNPDDVAELRMRGVLSDVTPSAVFDGCGVDVDEFTVQPLPTGTITFVMVGRLLADKGLREYAAAARRLRDQGVSARFVLVGGIDVNPEAVPLSEVQGWVADGVLEWVGLVADVRPILAAAHVFVLPSYREGLPQSTLEAMAMGRPVVTTDVPGCRETVRHEINGLVVPARDAAALAKACLRFVNEPGLSARMGRAGRDLAEARFESGKVARSVIQFMGLDNGEVGRMR